jgi:hypothetical protein
MFEVRSNSPMDDEWQERDKTIMDAATGFRHAHSGAGVGHLSGHGRDHGWYVDTFDDAQTLKARLEEVPEVVATIREK